MTEDPHVFPDREHAAERYLLGDMTEADRERYEAHFFSCAECAEDVRTTAAFLDDVRRIVDPSAKHVLPRPDPAPAPPQPQLLDWLRSLFWPLPAGAAVAATLLLAIIGYQMVHIAGLRRTVSEGQQALAQAQDQTVPSFFLSAARSEASEVKVSSRQRQFTLRVDNSFGRTFPFYRLEFRDAAERVAWSHVFDAATLTDELQFPAPSNVLTPGAYTAYITGLESAASTTSPLEPVHYPFTFKRLP